MLLSARMLNNVSNVNNWDYSQPLQATQGDTFNAYFQLIDLSKEPSTQGFQPNGRRYMPASGATLQATLDNIDDAVKVTRTAVQAFPTSDPSIWYISIMATDTITGTISLRFILNEAGKKTYGSLQAAINIQPQESFC